ncbi:MAG: hypothetical protein E7Z64_07425 [Thermoplasmata archaeon]|nr:hypothetical protein [Thermoplasmata archaeon]
MSVCLQAQCDGKVGLGTGPIILQHILQSFRPAVVPQKQFRSQSTAGYRVVTAKSRYGIFRLDEFPAVEMDP